MFLIFDLDGTVIDSTHRKATKPDGTLDLDHWRENSTPEMIAKDSLLPLADIWRANYRRPNGPTIMVCTARVLSDADYWYLAENDLIAHHILSRPSGCRVPDAELKHAMLGIHAGTVLGLSWKRFAAESLMFDDCPKVIEHLNEHGLRVIDARGYNAILGPSRKIA